VSLHKSSAEQEPVQKTSESSNSPNQLTFTESEVGLVVDFVNFVATKAVFNDMTLKDIGVAHKLYTNMVKHCKVCEDHIMELKAVYQR